MIQPMQLCMQCLGVCLGQKFPEFCVLKMLLLRFLSKILPTVVRSWKQDKLQFLMYSTCIPKICIILAGSM